MYVQHLLCVCMCVFCRASHCWIILCTHYVHTPRFESLCEFLRFIHMFIMFQQRFNVQYTQKKKKTSYRRAAPMFCVRLESLSLCLDLGSFSLVEKPQQNRLRIAGRGSCCVKMTSLAAALLVHWWDQCRVEPTPVLTLRIT